MKQETKLSPYEGDQDNCLHISSQSPKPKFLNNCLGSAHCQCRRQMVGASLFWSHIPNSDFCGLHALCEEKISGGKGSQTL